MKIPYQRIKFSDSKLVVIEKANEIIAEFEEQGYDLTLRQLYYQFVANDLIPNKQSEYKKLGVIINDARLAGLVSWRAIVDRTRNLQGNSHWDGPAAIIRQSAEQYQIDKWKNQPHRVEVWIEKDALAGVIEGVCTRNDVDFFSCRGYTSQSEMWAAGMRLKRYGRAGQDVTILHLGDHDPSGVDMTRDIFERLNMFAGTKINVERIALNMDQVKKYNPPPNPAKITDKRAAAYIRQHGMKSWELDALSPSTLDKLIEKHILELRDVDLWEEKIQEEQTDREALEEVADKMEE